MFSACNTDVAWAKITVKEEVLAQLQALSIYNIFSLEVELVSLLNMMSNVYICNNSVSET